VAKAADDGAGDVVQDRNGSQKYHVRKNEPHFYATLGDAPKIQDS
jgi:hypothetical protein